MTERLPRPERRKQLLDVARSVLAQQGYYDTTMAQIAEAAGVTKPVLYQHFDTKHDLYRTLLLDFGSELQARVTSAATTTDIPRDRVRAGIAAFVDFVAAEPDGCRIFYNGVNRHDPEWAAITYEVEESLCDAVVALIDVEGVSSPRRRVFARAIMGLAETSVRYAWFDRDLPIDQATLTNDITAMVWGGVRYIGVEDGGANLQP